ncbi:MAG: alpha/beta hydrolase [Myxococcales bacterium]|nr:alpha/beta hydrolase [Myxococcales bacterium]MCB9731386.1 alpha/beta hydrolase [Deltaproteobacteria bacterium]
MEGFERRDIVVDDGVKLAVFDLPHADDDAPVLFLSNGLGGNVVTWRHQIRHFKERFRIATWDYRGLYESALPPAQRAPGAVKLDIPRHAKDAIAVLDALGIDRAVFLGWSMGVQLDFELFRRIPDRMLGLVQIAGSFGRSLSTTLFGKPGEKLIMPAMGVFKEVVRRAGGILDRAVDSGVLIGAAKRLGVVAPSIDAALTGEIVKSYVKLDFDVYNRILATLGDHDAFDVLPGLDRPVLVIAGDKDPMTPSWLSEKMVKALPRATLEIVPGGSHYVPVEFPTRVNGAIDRFLDASFPDLLGA